MKKIVSSSLILFLSLIVALEVLALSAPAKQSDMELVHSDSSRSLYINTGTIVSSVWGKVNLWTKTVPAKGSPYLAETQNILKRAGKNPGKVEYFHTLQEVDCQTYHAKILSVVYYDKQGRIILSGVTSMPHRGSMASVDGAYSVWRTVCGVSSEDRNGNEYGLAQSDAVSTQNQNRR